MANIISYNYDRIIAEKPHYTGRISKEFLSFNGTKYTEGVKGIANAYIPCGDHYLIINEKNALYAMLLQTSIELEISNPYFSNPLRNFDKCVQLLMPYDLEADCVSSRFYRGILRGAGVKDDTRNALNSKAFKDLFQYELTSRYECVNEELGGHYEESYIAAVGAELFQEIMDEEEEKSGGKLTMTDFMRALIQEKCANILRSQYGWEFRYREYDDIVVNEDMMFMVRLAFPELAALVDEARNTMVNGEGFGPALGMKIMQSEDTNPIAHSEIYKAAKRRGLQQIEEMIDYSEEEETRYIKRHRDENPCDDVLKDAYVHTLVREFLSKANDKRGVEPAEYIVERDIYEITICIRNKQMRWH